MKQNDPMEELFKRLEGSFDTEETPVDHQRRFLEKLQASNAATPKKTSSFSNWWKPLSIAATIILLITLGFNVNRGETEQDGLAGISPEMEQTESFFVNTINQELEILKSFENEDSKALVTDAMLRMKVLEEEYSQLKLDLTESGNDKRVIAGMITNFQNRIELLQQVIATIEDIKTLKANKNETIL